MWCRSGCRTRCRWGPRRRWTRARAMWRRGSSRLRGAGRMSASRRWGFAATINASIECLRPLGRHVQVGLPIGHTARMEVNMNAVYMKQLALFGTRGMPSWRYPSLLTLIEMGRVDVAPIVARTGALVGRRARSCGPSTRRCRPAWRSSTISRPSAGGGAGGGSIAWTPGIFRSGVWSGAELPAVPTGRRRAIAVCAAHPACTERRP